MSDFGYNPYPEYQPSEMRGTAYAPCEVAVPTKAQLDITQMHYGGSAGNAPCYSCMSQDQEIKKTQMYSAGRILGIGGAGLLVGALVIGIIVFMMKKR